VKQSIASRINARNKKRITALAQSIEQSGVSAAIKFAESVLLGNSSANKELRANAALMLLQLAPEDPAIWHDYEVNMILRERSAELIAERQKLPTALCAFAAKALRMSLPPKRRGRPSDAWLRELVYVTLRDLKLAGIRVYEGDDSNGAAAFTGVEAVTKVIEIEERTLRKWWQGRSKEAWDI
jgi:hypothetical protein